jgi:hypothetical protein
LGKGEITPIRAVFPRVSGSDQVRLNEHNCSVIFANETLYQLSYAPGNRCLNRLYARVRVDGKEIKRSLGNSDRNLAKRKPAECKEEQSQIDRSQGMLPVREFCARYLKTVQEAQFPLLRPSLPARIVGGSRRTL